MSITFNKYAYGGNDGNTTAIDSTGTFEVTVYVTPPPRGSEQWTDAQKREQKNQRRIDAAIQAFNGLGNTQMPVGQVLPLTADTTATIKRLK